MSVDRPHAGYASAGVRPDSSRGLFLKDLALFVAEFVARVLVSVAVADAVAVTVPLPVLVAVALLETVGEALALALGNLRERHATCAPLKCATVTPV